MSAHSYLRVAALIALAGAARAQYTITTIAGKGPGNGVIATAFAVGQPGIALDNSNGVLYVSSASCNCIYSISNQSQFAEMAVGNGSRGVAVNGQAVTALLSGPAGLALDSTGRLYIADLFNNVIRRVDFRAGTITTVAGNGTQGYANGAAATTAELDQPQAVAVDGSGNIYIADTGNNAIREVLASSNTMITIAQGLNAPGGVAADGMGSVYIADTGNHRVINAALTTIAGTGTGAYNGDSNTVMGRVISSLSPSIAAAGASFPTITLMGSYFVNGDQVIWQNTASGSVATPLTTTFANDTELTATVPASLLTAAGTVNVSVSVPGENPAGPATFTISPALTITAPVSGSSSTSTSVLITATGATANGTVSVRVDGTPVQTATASASGSVSATITVSAGTHTLTVTDQNTGFTSAPVTITILQGVVPVSIVETIAVSDSPPTAAENIHVTDTPTVIAITPPSAPFLATNSSYNIPFSISGASGLMVVVTGLPPGMTYSNGAIGGTPNAAGTYTVTVTLVNAAGGTVLSSSFRIVVAVGIPIMESIGVLDSQPIDTETITVTDTPTVTPYFPNGNTPMGAVITVQPADTASQQPLVTVTFPMVTTAGVTTLTTSSTGPAAPSGFMLGTPPVYYNLSTTAQASGTFTVCIDFTGQSFQGTPSLQHYQNGQWVNITTSYNAGASVICGSVTSLSPFAIFQPATGITSGLCLYPVTPCRVVDTRAGHGFTGQFGPPSMTAGQTRSFTIPASGCNIPTTAQSYSLNVTVVPAATLGYLTIWPAGQTQPYVSTLNSLNGAVLANAAIVPAGMGGGVSVFVTDATDLVIDIDGYFAPPTASALAFYPVTPCRVADTRNANGPFGGPSLSSGATRSFAVPQSSCGIPPTAQAYSLNMTAVPPGPLEYLTTWPTGQTQPVVSTLNALQGQIAANAALVPAGTGGAISVLVSDPSNVIVDINGYFAPPGSPGALYFYPLTPCRVADTRNATGGFGGPSLGAGSTRSFPIPSSSCGLPSTAQAYSLNMTAVPPGSLLYLSTWPAGQAQPVVSTLNDLQGQIIANAAIVPAGTSGGITVFVSDTTNLIIDINGYFGQ